jgi:hypothetical protein
MRYGIAYDALAYYRANQSDDYARRWQKPGDEQRTNVPSFTYPTDSSRDQFYNQSSVNVEKGDNIRLQDARLAYDLGARQAERPRAETLAALCIRREPRPGVESHQNFPGSRLSL